VDPESGRKQLGFVEMLGAIEWTEERSYHFRLSALAPQLQNFYQANPGQTVPRARYEKLIVAVENCLGDLSIRGPSPPCHCDTPMTTHSLIEYLRLALRAEKLPHQHHILNRPSSLPLPPPPSGQQTHSATHVTDKNALRFHTIYCPAFLLALNLPFPRHLLTYAHWTSNRRKMSKNDGNAANPVSALPEFRRGCHVLLPPSQRGHHR